MSTYAGSFYCICFALCSVVTKRQMLAKFTCFKNGDRQLDFYPAYRSVKHNGHFRRQRIRCFAPSLSRLNLIFSRQPNFLPTTLPLACVADVQRGGRGEVECEREARSLGAGRERAPNDRASRSHSTSPLPPLCTPATQATLPLKKYLSC